MKKILRIKDLLHPVKNSRNQQISYNLKKRQLKLFNLTPRDIENAVIIKGKKKWRI